MTKAGRIKELERANKIDREWIEENPCNGENSFIEHCIREREKEIEEIRLGKKSPNHRIETITAYDGEAYTIDYDI